MTRARVRVSLDKRAGKDEDPQANHVDVATRASREIQHGNARDALKIFRESD